MHTPHVLARMVKEIDENVSDEKEVYDFAGLESRLPYTLAALKESFRMNPVAALLLPRTVTDVQGMLISGEVIPRGVSSTQDYTLPSTVANTLDRSIAQ